MNQLNLKIVILFSVLLSVIFHVHAQRTNFRIHEYNKQNKLGEELVKYTAQDSLGIYYFATDAGVFSLVNDRFNKFDIPEGKTNYFKELLKLRDGNLIAISDDAIYKIKASFESNDISLLVEANEDPAAPKYPKHAYEDKKGRIWISDYNHIFRMNHTTLEKYSMDEKNLTSSYARSYQFLECDNGNLIVASQKGWFYRYNEKGNAFEELDYQPGFLIHSSFKIGSNEFLIGSSKGIIKIIFDFKGRVVHEEIISKDVIASCFEELSEDRVLAGTWFQGLIEIQLNEQHKFYPVGGFPYFTVNDIYKDDFGKYWVSTNSGVIVLEKKFFASQFLTTNSEYIASISENEKGEVLFAGRDHLYKIKGDQNIQEEEIYFDGSLNVFQSKNGLTLIGTEQGQLVVIKDGAENEYIKISNQAITSVEIISERMVWVVANKELFRVHIDTKKVKSYLEDFNNRRIVQDICLSDQGELYVGGEYEHSYLFVHCQNNDDFINLSKKFTFDFGNDFWIRDLEIDGDTIYLGSSGGLLKQYEEKLELVDLGEMSNSEINGVAIDQFHALWLTTSNGVIRKRKDGVSLFTPEHGLPSKTFTTKNLLVDKRGFLWVGTSNGLAYAHVSDSIPETPKPVVHLAKDKTIYINSDTDVEVNANSMLLLDVTALIYPQKQNQFQYCVTKGEEQVRKWKELSSKNQILIDNLAPGKYSIQVRCKHEGNYSWSDSRVIPLRVNQVWYLRWYTILAELLMLGLLVFATSVYNKRRAQRHMDELETLVSERTVQLQNANQKLMMANKAKDKFLSIIGHDLRNPFNAIRSFSKMLLDDDGFLAEEEKKELMGMIYKSSNDTFKLLESLLEWANVQKGKFKLNKAEFDLNEILNSNLDLHKNLASVKEIKVVGDFDQTKVFADRAMVDTVVRNLMSNAIKYSYPDQTITLRSKVNHNFVEIQVADEGMGMSESQMKNLFKIDTVFSSEGTANETGTGFGLMLSKEFVEMNGGNIWVKSKVNEGTTFSFTVPLRSM
jgi:signal transduction histidine kinase/ligand-binding sensor domain-containing protein